MYMIQPNKVKKKGDFLTNYGHMLKPRGRTWAVLLIGEISTIIGSITLPGGGVAESGELTLLECHSLHTQTEVAGAVGSG